MSRLIEILLGLPRQFLSREGELSVRFNPVWPWQEAIGAAVWNVLIAGAFAWLIVYVYRRDGRSVRGKVALGVLRGLLAGLVLLLLNRPIVTLTQNRVEPSVVAVMIDDSLSMRVRDVAAASTGDAATRPAVSRLEAVREALGGAEAGLLRELSKEHSIRLYRFDREAATIGAVSAGPGGAVVLPEALERVRAEGQGTALGASLVRVASDLAGQRLAGVVILTDGRESPARPATEVVARLRESGVKVFAVEVGGERPPRNLAVQNVVVQDAAFVGDLVAAKVTVRGTGYPPGTRVAVRLTDARTGRPVPGPAGVAEAQVIITGDDAVDVEVPLKPEAVGDLNLSVTATVDGANAGGEIDDADNTRVARLSVLDAKVNVLYVEGYPRWDYRFLRSGLIRDKSTDVSILLTSADEGFAQDGDKPIRRFPETIDELLPYDAVIIGDVDPRQFTDNQLQLISDYVGKKGGGLLMVAGPRFAPARYRGSPLEAALPVSLARVENPDPTAGSDLVVGFRPSVTTAGLASGVFRFLSDASANDRFLKTDLQPVFWYLRGVAVKPGAGETLAEHPADLGPDGKRAPILVAGRYGAGRTLFSAIDESWRWRYYSGESVFDTYWIQQIRLLARNRKLGQRLFALSTSRSTYELGERVTVTLRVLDQNLLRQLPDRIDAEVTDDAGQLVRKEGLVRQEDRPDTYVGTFPADRLGRGAVRVPFLAPGVMPATDADGTINASVGTASASSVPVEVVAPRLELADVRVDRAALQRFASETGGSALTLAESREKLPALVTSAAKVIPLESSRPLWDAPLAMVLFVLLLAAEWVLRKLFGMV